MFLGIDAGGTGDYNGNRCSYYADKKENEGRKGMAFSCVMRMKEECDGCMMCVEWNRRRTQEDEA